MLEAVLVFLTHELLTHKHGSILQLVREQSFTDQLEERERQCFRFQLTLRVLDGEGFWEGADVWLLLFLLTL